MSAYPSRPPGSSSSSPSSKLTVLPQSFNQLAAVQTLRLWGNQPSGLLESFGLRAALQALTLCRLYINGAIASLDDLQISPAKTKAREHWQQHLLRTVDPA